MIVIKTEKQMKEVEVTIENHVLCDKCNEKIEPDNFDAFQCEFKLKTGHSFPDGSGGELQEMDICEKCADNLVELLRNNGYRVNDGEWGY